MLKGQDHHMRKQSIHIIIPLQMHSFTQQTFINKQFILNSSNRQLMKYIIKEKNGLISYVLIAFFFSNSTFSTKNGY